MDDMHGLRVWDSARGLTAELVAIAQRNRRRDPAGILKQLCRAANSIGANLTESCGAATPRERLQFLRFAHRSAWETRHHVRASYDCGFMNAKTYRPLAARAAIVVRMISSLIATLERAEAKRAKESAA
jgi:four helix bundle protein